MNSVTHKKQIVMTILISALGYFVDIYDLLLFSIVRKSSLLSLGVPESELLHEGIRLINSQMIGMLVGGILWGILGDKRGRVSVLFGSIFLYSIANILNGFAVNVDQYFVLRFFAGVGLAGELGAAITLVSEIMPKESRGYGTAVVASVGICGAVVAALIGDAFSWRTAYFIGGGLGLALLAMRMSMLESGMFKSVKDKATVRGDIKMLFNNKGRFLTYMASILIGIPIWFVIGILVTFSPELAKEIGVGTMAANSELTGGTGVAAVVTSGKAVMYSYMGLAIGDLISGLLSQYFRSRKKIVAAFLCLTAFFTFIYCYGPRGYSVDAFYLLCLALGFSTGYWAVFVTMAAEQFGTNLRATVTTTTPNFVRGSVVIITFLFDTFKQGGSLLDAAFMTGSITFAVAFIGLFILKETHGKDLDYVDV